MQILCCKELNRLALKEMYSPGVRPWKLLLGFFWGGGGWGGGGGGGVFTHAAIVVLGHCILRYHQDWLTASTPGVSCICMLVDSPELSARVGFPVPLYHVPCLTHVLTDHNDGRVH